jgi:hypothetical protein
VALISTAQWRCLSSDRQNSYQSALALNQELQRFLTGEPITSIHSKSYQVRKNSSNTVFVVNELFMAVGDDGKFEIGCNVNGDPSSKDWIGLFKSPKTLKKR